MRADAHISTTRTEVRSGLLARHVAIKLDGGRAFALATGLGMPRMWSYASTATIDGVERAFEESKAERGLPRLRSVLGAARNALAARCDQLVERALPTLITESSPESIESSTSVGSGRVYLLRKSRPRRLTARDEPAGGLLRARPCECSIALEPGDLVLAGSLTAFSTSSIARAVSVLAADPETTPAVLASLLTEPAGKAGVGAAALVLRVR
ncbi:MAG: hypothetical protein K8H88_23060 [Sandaracinaceae bacterium]|nr:hypothetical protein [Sandaracinaceae bacterium]